MTGIGGLIRRDGRAVTHDELGAFADRLVHRGGDARGEWRSGPVGLVHLARFTTPESQIERQPVELAGSGLRVVADARLDNRRQLWSELGLESPLERTGDAELALRAFDRWGPGCALRLLGDFALVAWDPVARRLFCVRDPFGVKPLFFHLGEHVFACASEIQALLVLPDVPKRLDRLKIALYLEEITEDQSTTFYTGIQALPAAHWLLVEPGRVVQERYYRLDPTRELPDGDVVGHAEEFRRLFTQSVQDRVRSAFPVGSMLSGGLDSSSIVCAARGMVGHAGERPLQTFSIVFDDVPQCDEREFAASVVAGGGVEAHVLRGDQMDPLGDVGFLSHPDGACYGANLFLNRGLYRLAADRGVRVLLDGTDGDSVVGYGFERLLELLMSLRLSTLLVELSLLGGRLQRSRLRMLTHFVFRPLAAALRAAGARQWQRLVGAPPPRPLRPAVPGRVGARPGFARSVGLAEYLERIRPAHPAPALTARAVQHRALESGIHTAALGFLDRASADSGVEVRYPFFDRRLVEFCLALPAADRLHQGWTRYIQRLGSDLPAMVRWRGWKADLGANLGRGLVLHDQEVMAHALRAGSVLEEFVDLQAGRALLARFLARPRAGEAFQLSKTTALAVWLDSAMIAIRSCTDPERRSGSNATQ